MNDRTVKSTELSGIFGLPLGVRFLNHSVGDYPKSISVSTVCLEGGHLEDSFNMCDAEYGYETMVFLEGCTFFSLFTAKYKTRREASRGHASVVRKLQSGNLPLAIPLGYYNAHQPTDRP